jgi:hypothetical protein
VKLKVNNLATFFLVAPMLSSVGRPVTKPSATRGDVKRKRAAPGGVVSGQHNKVFSLFNVDDLQRGSLNPKQPVSHKEVQERYSNVAEKLTMRLAHYRKETSKRSQRALQAAHKTSTNQL